MKNQNEESQTTRRMVTPRLAQHLSGIYTPPEIRAFFSADMHPAYRRAFYVMLYTGIKACDLVHVSPDDYTVEGDYIRITTQTRIGKQSYELMQEYPWNEILMDTILDSYCNRPSKDHLFGDAEGKPLTVRTLAIECRRIGATVGIQKPMRLQYFVNTFYCFIRYREDQSPFHSICLSWGYGAQTPIV